MTTAILGQNKSWTEEEFLALGETPERVELFDGTLHVSPGPAVPHQTISYELGCAMREPARKAGLRVRLTINLRLKTGTIPIPDLVITRPVKQKQTVIDADVTLLVCEVVSPSNAAADRVTKMHYYAAAGIPWYLLIEQSTSALHLHKLIGSHYVEQSVTHLGEVFVLTEPIEFAIDTQELFEDD